MTKDNDLSAFGTEKVVNEELENLARKVQRLKRARPLLDAYEEEDEDDENSSKEITQWTEHLQDFFVPVGKTKNVLKAGFYSPSRMGDRLGFFKNDVIVDDLILFKESKIHDILLEINKFWTLEENFKKYGFVQKRGILIWGPQGSGKTAGVQLIMQDIIRRNGIILSGENPSNLISALRLFRLVEPERKIICLFEDIDSIIENFGESVILSLLDGEIQINKVLNIAVTNYPERLDKRIVSRPRRFDRIVFMDMPVESVRREYFIKKLNLDDKEVDKWVKATKGLSFASLAEAVISVKCLENSFEETISRLRSIEEKKITSSDYMEKSVGFAKAERRKK